MLKAGDRVFIDGTSEEGTIKEVHPHEMIVHVKTTQGPKFDLRLIDAFGKLIRNESGTISGTFSPQVEIKPRKGLDGRYFTQPDANYPSSPAWDLSNFDNSVKRVEYVLNSVAFSDGTTWTSSALR